MLLQLNFNKPDNYAFFCPVSRVHLTRSNPVAQVNEVTPYIEKGLKYKSIIDITDNTVTGQKIANQPVKEDNETTEAMPSVEESAEKPVEEPVAATVEEVKEETVSVESEPAQQEAPAEPSKPKKGRQKKA